MSATPDIFAHLTHLLMNLADGKVCAVLEVSEQSSSLANTNVPSSSWTLSPFRFTTLCFRNLILTHPLYKHEVLIPVLMLLWSLVLLKINGLAFLSLPINLSAVGSTLPAICDRTLSSAAWAMPRGCAALYRIIDTHCLCPYRREGTTWPLWLSRCARQSRPCSVIPHLIQSNSVVPVKGLTFNLARDDSFA